MKRIFPFFLLPLLLGVMVARAQLWQPIPIGMILGGGGGSGITWSPTDNGGGVTFSNANLTVESDGTASGGRTNIRATATCATAKFYYEYTAVAVNGSYPTGFLANPSQILNTDFLGDTNNSVGYLSGGAVYTDGTNFANISSYTSGDTIQVAVDATSSTPVKAWLKVNAGNWNNDAGANPATGANPLNLVGTGGADYFVTTGGIFPAIGLNNVAGEIATGNFGATTFFGAVPAGFSKCNP